MIYRLKRYNNPEGQIQLQIIRYLKSLGFAVGKTRTMGVRNPEGGYRLDPYTFRGFPDLTAFVPELLFIEVKAERGRFTEYQRDFQELCEKAGITYIVARSIEDVEEYLMGRGKERL